MEAAAPPLALTGVLVGALFGAVVERTHFCTMGAVSDVVLFGSGRRARMWLAAALTALVATLSLHALSDFQLSETAWRSPAGLVALVLGGLSFGMGMVLAGGCASRSLVRFGTGSLKALIVLLPLAILAAAMMLGPLAPLTRSLRDTAPLPLTLQLSDAVVGVVILLVGLAVLLQDPRFRQLRGPLGAGILLGLPVALAWTASHAVVIADPFASVAETGLTFVRPLAESLWWLTLGQSAQGLGLGLIIGVVLGAGVSAALAGRWRVEGFQNTDDLIRHLIGGALMGIGGVLAGGCTIGQGVTGVSTLAADAMIAVAAMVAGAVMTLQSLVHGGPHRWLAQWWHAAFR